MIHTLNRLATRACDLLLLPLAKLPAFWSVLFLSLLTSLFVLLVYRWISSPARVRQAKQRIKAHILAIRLYRDFWQTIVASFLRSLFYTGKYFLLNLGPLLAVLPLLFLLFVQMDIRFGMRPLRVGESVLLKARLSGGAGGRDATVLPGTGYRVAMNPVCIDALGEINWKIQATAPGRAAVAIRVDGVTVRKSLDVGPRLVALSNRKLAASSPAHFLYPAEGLLEASGPIQSLAIRYPAQSVSFLGLRAHWLVWYLLLTFAFALALKKRFGVEF